ncbi:MAG: acyl-CoA thioesterase [Acidobacteria bacterium]|nr:acyl-CoA thioesterase [Acidobacteriota bacterium]
MTSRAGWRDEWYVVPYEVTWRDLDGLGHVNNAVYFTYFEWARTRYWFDLMGIDEPGPTSIGFIVAHASCEFRLQLTLLQSIGIGVRTGEIRDSSFDFHYRVLTESGEVAATGKVVAVLFDWERNQKIRIEQSLREKIRRFEAGEGE